MDPAQPTSGGEELKKLENELKTLGNTPQEQPAAPTTPEPVVEVPGAPIPKSPPTPWPEAPQSSTPQETPPPQGGSKVSKVLMVALGLLVLSLIGVGAYFFATRNTGQKTCTEDAKLCPDGSYVGRTGPNCEFAPCPSPPTTPEPTEEASVTPTATGSASPTSSPTASPTTIPSATPSASPQL